MLSTLLAILNLRAVAQNEPPSTELQFLEEHWRTPIPSQGPPPPGFTPVEASLKPEACGQCHQQQYRDWKTTMHAKSMGPGVLAQTQAFAEGDPATAALCYSCHAPLTEQQEVREVSGGGGRAQYQNNPSFDPDLQHAGLTCAGCHLRQRQYFGPPRREDAPRMALPRASLPHGGFTATPAFQQAEFCRSCHQFSEDGYALNGKLLENTYNEWKEGPYAKAGIQCQNCHMPDRRHLWRGIHDPEQVKNGVTIRLTSGKERYRPGETLEATLVVINSAVGHYFPTYVTPQVVIRATLLDSQGRTIPETAQEAVIGREVTLDLSREVYDTRVPPDGQFTFRYRQPVQAPGWRLHVDVTVYPDHFYTRFFEANLASNAFPQGRTLLEQALENTRRSAFSIFTRDLPVS